MITIMIMKMMPILMKSDYHKTNQNKAESPPPPPPLLARHNKREEKRGTGERRKISESREREKVLAKKEGNKETQHRKKGRAQRQSYGVISSPVSPLYLRNWLWFRAYR